MKCRFTFFILVCSTWIAYAGPNMSANMLGNSLNDYSKLNHCNHKKDSEIENYLSEINIDNALATEVSCQIQCKKGSVEIKTLYLNFIPTELGLRPGDGSRSRTNYLTAYENILWSSLTVFLKTWANDSCLKLAIERCESIQKVKQAKSTKMSSGKWSFDYKTSCEGKEEILSPFEISAESRFELYEKPSDLKIKDSYPKLTGKAYYADKKEKCSHVIKAKICFGDCVASGKVKGDDWKELLQSAVKDDITQDKIEVCADNLYEQFSKDQLSNNVKKNLCEKFFWDSLYESHTMGTSCQAARGKVDCAQLL